MVKLQPVKKLIACFAKDLTATQAGKLVGVNRNTANLWFHHFRENILKHHENNTPSFKGEVELDESYFGGPRKRSTPYTDKRRSYDGLVFDGYKHYRINHSKEYSDGKGNHINGIENFWSFAKRRLSKFNGVSRKTFLLNLKECKLRYNHKDAVLKILSKII